MSSEDGSEKDHARSARTPHDPVSIDRGIDRLERWRNSKEGQRAEGNLRGQRARGGVEKLLTRTTSGAIYAIVVVGCFLLGHISTAFLVAAMAWLCCSEFFHMCRLGGRMPNETFGLAAAVLFPIAAHFAGMHGVLLLTFILVFACGIWFVFTPRANVADVAATVFGPIYTSLMFSSVVFIRDMEAGFPGGCLVLGAVLSVWANDACAYLVGSRIGRHKLAPRISPKKSWEGLFGGLAASIVIWVLMSVFGIDTLSIPMSVSAGVLVGLAGIFGDLFESRIKRGVGVKDSGNFMPGHGGLLDRSDSMLFGCMVAYFVLLIGGLR